VVHRSDASGTTAIFTGYLAQISGEWQEQFGEGKDVDWPVGIGGQGNDGVAAVVQQQRGSVGYVELSYALETGLAMATLQNRAGNRVEPTLEATAAAAEDVDFPADLRFSVSDSPGERAYPIVGATWILAYERMPSGVEAAALKEFLRWALTEGDELARELGYAPLPEELERLALDKVDRIETGG
jgi:phosphate transport system substrate-binding protein